MCQCRFMNYNRILFWWGMLTWGRLRTYEGGEYRKSLNLLFNTVVNLKLLKKKKKSIRKRKRKKDPRQYNHVKYYRKKVRGRRRYYKTWEY